ncbi:MAG: hypothetical protein ACI828_002031 [Flavobacteriales bacterium]|jgi:uncharacterized protein (TIGR01777 family)
MKVLITGATGLVGTKLSVMCRDQGISVHYLTTSRSRISSEDSYKGFYWNPSQGEIDDRCFEGVDAIIHLAGASIAQRWTDKNKRIIKESRIHSAALMRSTLSQKRKEGNCTVKHIISASAIGVYPSSLTKYYDETYPGYAEGFLGEVVQEWEKEITKFQKDDIATTLVRTGIVLDAKKGALPKIAQPIKWYAGSPIGSGEQWQSWIHVDDMVGIYLHLLKNELTGVYNGVAPNPVTNKKLTQIIAKTLGKPLILPKVPSFALKLLLGDMSTIVMESQKVCADKIRESGFVFEHTTIEETIPSILKN